MRQIADRLPSLLRGLAMAGSGLRYHLSFPTLHVPRFAQEEGTQVRFL